MKFKPSAQERNGQRNHFMEEDKQFTEHQILMNSKAGLTCAGKFR